MNFSRSSSLPSRSLPSGGLMLLVLLALAVLLLVPGMAHAADLFTVPSTDKSKTLFLDKIFGDFSASPLAGPVTVFNSAVLFVGGILAAYTIIAGTMSTAHDGEMLGQKWSSMWIPVRTAIGTAAILPVLNGFCVAQSIVLWLATQGIGLADAIWNQFSSNPIQTMSVSTGTLNMNVSAMATAMFRSNLCVIAYKNSAANQQTAADASGQATLGTPTYTANPITVSSGQTGVGYQYGDTSGTEAASKVICGQVFMPTSAPSTPATTGLTSSDSLNADVISMAAPVVSAQTTQFNNLQSAMASAAQSFYANQSFDAVGAIQSATSTYSSAMLSAAQGAVSNSDALSAFRQDVQQDGWAFAGAWYMKLIRIQDAISGAANRAATIEHVYSNDNIANSDEVTSRLKAFDDVLNQNAIASQGSGVNKAAITDMNFSSKSSTTMGKLSDFITSISNGMNQISGAATNPQSVVSGMMGSILDLGTDLNDPTKNGLLAAKNLGDLFINAGWVVAGTGALLAILGGSGIGLVFGGFAFTMWTIGSGLAVVLPMTPFIMWVGIMIGWLIQVVEAVFAAPLWAVVHMHPDGDGVVGRGGAGYALVLALTLRPALMIMGLISALVLMDPLTYFLNSVFFGAFRLMQGNTTTGPVTAVAIAAMYCSAMFMVIRKTFALIHVIPDQILQWIGNGAPSLGGSAQDAASKAQEGHSSIIQGVGQFGNAAVRAGSAARQIQAQRQSTARQEEGNMNDMQSRFSDGAMDASLSANKARQQEGPARADFMNIAGQKLDRAIRDGETLQAMDKKGGGYKMNPEQREAVDNQVASLTAQREALRSEEKTARQESSQSAEAPAQPESSILGADGKPIGGGSGSSGGGGRRRYSSEMNDINEQ